MIVSPFVTRRLDHLYTVDNRAKRGKTQRISFELIYCSKTQNIWLKILDV